MNIRSDFICFMYVGGWWLLVVDGRYENMLTFMLCTSGVM